LIVDFLNLSDTDAEKLYRFRHDQFHPELLRTFAEDRMYLGIFQSVIELMLREVDSEFVRLVAMRANLAPKLTAKFLESITPLVKQSVAETMGKMVVSGLSSPSPAVMPSAPAVSADDEDLVDPSNPKILTTSAERKILYLTKEMLNGLVDQDDIIGKDTESYYTVLYQGKSNRWILRYHGDRQNPRVNFIFNLSEHDQEYVRMSGLEIGSGNSVLLTKPEQIMKLSSLLFKALQFCKDDENFKKKGTVSDQTDQGTYAQV